MEGKGKRGILCGGLLETLTMHCSGTGLVEAGTLGKCARPRATDVSLWRMLFQVIALSAAEGRN